MYQALEAFKDMSFYTKYSWALFWASFNKLGEYFVVAVLSRCCSDHGKQVHCERSNFQLKSGLLSKNFFAKVCHESNFVGTTGARINSLQSL